MASSLQSKDYKDLLDTIDKLRAHGISRYVPLPQIIVCGDQSSGKSSALEAISGVSFPTKDNLCTRFATELILRRSPTSDIKVGISPAPDRSIAEKAKLESFARTTASLDIGNIVEEAKIAMGLSDNERTFSRDVLRVEISGPSQPHLTMVDLPGLFLAGNKDQSAEDAALVKSLVLEYMESPRSFILAVVSAKSDFALQQVTELTRAVDPNGDRTLGLITKPDTLDEGSDSERFYVDLAQNKDVYFRLGWHVLRNRDFTMRNASTAERDDVEKSFFSKGMWTALKMSQFGIVSLRERLSDVLWDQIVGSLPSVLDDVQNGLKNCRMRFEKMGAPRTTLAQQTRFLVRASESFSTLVKAAVNGEYTDPFFSRPFADDGFRKRLRAIVQKRLTTFAENMRKTGEARRIVEEGPSSPNTVSRTDYMLEVKNMMEIGRGRELPGTFSPLIVVELFRNQCAPWEAMAYDICNTIIDDVERTLTLILEHIVNEDVAAILLRSVLSPAMDIVKASLTAKVAELLDPHLSTHPITYNHYLVENVQKAQSHRLKFNMEKRLRNFLASGGVFRSGVPNTDLKPESLLKSLLDVVMTEVEPDMDRYGCSLAIDSMQAYYWVALKKFVDDVSVLAIEQCLLKKLPMLLSSDVILDLSDSEIQQIAGEHSDLAEERALVIEKANILEDGLAVLLQLRKSHVRARPVERILSGLNSGVDNHDSESEPEPEILRPGVEALEVGIAKYPESSVLKNSSTPKDSSISKDSLKPKDPLAPEASPALKDQPVLSIWGPEGKDSSKPKDPLAQKVSPALKNEAMLFGWGPESRDSLAPDNSPTLKDQPASLNWGLKGKDLLSPKESLAFKDQPALLNGGLTAKSPVAPKESPILKNVANFNFYPSTDARKHKKQF